MKQEDKNWLMERIQGMVKDPDAANFGIDTSRCDLEIIISVAEADRNVFTEEVLAELRTEINARTGVFATIYLEGNVPQWLAMGSYI